MLERLERRGYLTRSPHPTDRSKTIVRATHEVARRTEPLIRPLVADAAEEVLSPTPAKTKGC